MKRCDAAFLQGPGIFWRDLVPDPGKMMGSGGSGSGIPNVIDPVKISSSLDLLTFEMPLQCSAIKREILRLLDVS